MPLNLTWHQTQIGYRAQAGAFIVLAINDWAYSAVNGEECFTPAIAFQPAPGRQALVVARGLRMPQHLVDTKVAAEQLLVETVPRVREAFVGLLPGELLDVPGLGLGAPGDTAPFPKGSPAARGCWLELD